MYFSFPRYIRGSLIPFVQCVLHLSSLSICATALSGLCTGSFIHKTCSAKSITPISKSPSEPPCQCAGHVLMVTMSKWAVTDSCAFCGR
ncbi:hypothetical protein EV702DRAFT_784163 [Suillus placidus]|uniref:Uncharacterized protein n=1 Tax=Suillus placidus TaxID=48579 RepID=A0A9P6ZHR3_9AGAM|nr:hypothetical protein EV702DRAFT_784163 [Suillus placidus]